MKKTARSYTVFLGGELFSLKHLLGNAALAEAIADHSHGRFRCVLPQDFVELRGRRGRAIRDHNLRALVGCDLALLNFDGPDLDSGTIVEFMYAKFADVPTVLLRTDIRNAGDHRDEPWNLMASYFPRTVNVVVGGLFNYRGALRRSPNTTTTSRRRSSRAAGILRDEVAAHCVEALERVVAIPPVLPKHLREAAYHWLALAPGLSGTDDRVREEFDRLLNGKIERELL
jgi:nucleoside 2-deoxyribosyltransferase